MTARTFNKLVRDRIPDLCRADGQEPVFHTLDADAAFLNGLLEKLREETDEMIKDPSREEAADIFEVLVAVGTLKGFTANDLLKAAAEKRERRGGFTQRLFLRSVQER